MNTELFRKEVIDAQSKNLIGDVVLYRPISFTWLTLAALVITVSIVAFITIGEYTRKEVAEGYLTSSKGKVRIASPLAGKISERRVHEGDEVRAGDVLYVVSAERDSLEAGATLANAALALQSRQASLINEKQKQLALAQMNEVALISRQEKIGQELLQLRAEMNTQKERVAKAEQNAKRFRDLAAQNFVSATQVAQREEEKLEQVARLQGVERQAMGLEREIATLKQEIPLQHLRAETQIAGVDRALAIAAQESANFEGQRTLAVTAPIDGVVTAILGEVGQQVTPNNMLATILPSGADLEAHLLVSSRAIGFLSVGQPTRMRYSAFRFERFGHHRGVVSAISKTTINPLELPVLIESREPRYRVTVKLDRQDVEAYGKSYPLVAGMLLDADIQIEKRKLYQLILDPLYSVTGRLKW
jgi:membrane fusion protein